MDHNEAKNLIIKAGLELVRTGLISRTWGNVSCRVGETAFAVTPSGRDYQTLTPDDIVIVKIDDLSYSGSITPSSEKGIHAAVYQLRPEINFVIHTHQENASAMSAADLNFFEPPSDFSDLGEIILLANYALPGTKALCKNVIAALKQSSAKAMILKHHGALCFGRNYEDTFQAAYLLESACGALLNEKDRQIQTGPSLQTPLLFEEAKSLLSAWKVSDQPGYMEINTDFDVLRFSELQIPLKPLLDDFAQIVGMKIKTVENDPLLIFSALKSVSAVMVNGLGAVCRANKERDAKAVSMIVRKNCKAYFASLAFGRPKFIHPWECALMRQMYLKKYSRLAEENKSGGNR